MGGYVQKIENQNLKIKIQTRNFWQEIYDGIKMFFTYPKNLKELWWTKLLYFARIYLWLVIFWQIKILKKPFNKIWQRVESTK